MNYNLFNSKPTGLDLLIKVLVKQGMSVEEYLTTALKRVYVSDELPFDPELRI